MADVSRNIMDPSTPDDHSIASSTELVPDNYAANADSESV
jgi:hypothetical protein